MAVAAGLMSTLRRQSAMWDRMMYAYLYKHRLPSQLIILISLIFLILSIRIVADELDCSDYQVPEWQQICESNLSAVYIHENVSENGLNAEVDSWESRPGLHILPPKIYVIDKKIALKNQQWMLPNPTTSLPPGKQNRTIELSTSDQFSIGSDPYFTLIELSDQVSAGGVEIQGEGINDSTPGYKEAGERNIPRMLVYAPNSINVVVAGFVLSGREGIDKLVWNPFHDNYYWSFYGDGTRYLDDKPGFHFLRNHLTTNGALTGVLVSGGHHPPLIQDNAIIVTSSSTDNITTTGARLENGAAEIKHNDIVFSDGSAGSRMRLGIDIDGLSALSIDSNAFFSPANQEINNHDIGCRVSASTKWLNAAENSFSSFIKRWIFEGEDHKGAYVIKGNGYLNSASDEYRFTDAAQFMKYKGHLGSMPIASTELVHGFNNSSLTKKSIVPGPDYGSILQDLIARSGYFEECGPDCINRFDAIGISLLIISGIVSNIFCCGLGGWSLGARRCPCSAR